MGPLPQGNATGVRRAPASTDRSRFVALLGIWLIVCLQVPLLAVGMTLILSNILPPPDVDWFEFASRGTPLSIPTVGQHAVEAVSLLVALGLVVVNLVVLWKATGRYWAGRRAARRRRLCLCEQCGYDLRGTIAAGKDACPECGTARAVEEPASVAVPAPTPGAALE